MGKDYQKQVSIQTTVRAENTVTDVRNGDAIQNVIVGTPDDDILHGGRDNDSIRGLQRDDVIEGHRGNDRLLGNTGSDNLVGGAGNDWLNGFGRKGDCDRLTGGKGADTFVLGDEDNVFYPDNGWAKVVDFSQHDHDKILLHGNSSDYRLRAERLIGGAQLDTSIYYGDTLIGVVKDVTNMSLLSSDFNFL